MTQDNKDAALNLAKIEPRSDKYFWLRMTPWHLQHVTGEDMKRLLEYSRAIYDAARKPLEEHNARLSARAFKEEAEYETIMEHCRTLEQQLLATQEAYQRVAEALSAMMTHAGMDEDDWTKPTFDKARQALANPPSMEAVERKKLEDEIAVLDSASKWTHPEAIITEMIAERKAKLEKMK